MNAPRDIRKEMVALTPQLRIYARSLTRHPADADDLVQQTLLQALTAIDSFDGDRDVRAWLFTIQRNAFYSSRRKVSREVQDVDGAYAATLSVKPEQMGALELKEFMNAFAQLPDESREALTLIGVSGLRHSEAAEICGVAPGTMKSRVARARARLAEMLGIENAATIGTDVPEAYSASSV